jgi:predicted Rossmann fold nucleotide-binding protein DprA/Smf involved in DNA uptake
VLDAEYPSNLRMVHQHPPVLFVRGTADERDATSVAVIGTGIDRVYPPQNAGLQQEIAANGLLISQFLPGSPPTKASFPIRNAVMSGYTLATVVVEAADRSGSRMQGRLALRHGRHVFLMRSLLEREWARDYAERPGVTLVEAADDVFVGPATARVGADGSHLGLTAHGFCHGGLHPFPAARP